MKIAGIIAEYNPFHNGHLYQINKLKSEYSIDAVVVVLSGAFTQRGIPGVCDQHLRTKMALENGADLCFELPLYSSCASAEYFAEGAVSLLDKLGCIDYLCFGSETDDINALELASSRLCNLSSAEDELIGKYLNEGYSYPKARSLALNIDEKLIGTPNNILAIEYLKALAARNSSIKPVSIVRSSNNYNEESLSENGLSSASAIRRILESGENFEVLNKHLPENVYSLINGSNIFFPIFMNDFSDYLLYQLHLNHEKGYEDFYDVGEFLSNTFSNKLYDFKDFSSFVLECKSKNYTYTRINRALTHIMLNMTEDFAISFKENDYSLYAKLLGFTEAGKDVLGFIKKNSSIPVISKAANAEKLISGIALEEFNQDIFASNLYESVRARKYKKKFISEFSKEIVHK